MNNIRKVIIENFQSHESTEMEFEDGLNVIVGPSDQGKSAVIRAIKWVLFNQPRGIEFIRHGAKSAKVEIEMSNGFRVIREKSSSRNRYTVIDPEGETSVFEGFGNEVPEEVRKAHGVAKVVIDTDRDVSLNLGEQLEGPFLVSETGAVKAKAIGRLTGVHIVDRATRECINDIKKENQIEGRCKNEIKELEQKLNMYEHLDLLEKNISVREENVKEIEKLANTLHKLDTLRSRLSFVNYEIRVESEIIRKTVNIKEIKGKIDDLEKKAHTIDRLKRQKVGLENVEKELEKAEQRLSLLDKIKQVETNVLRVSELYTRRSSLERLKNLMNSVESSINEGSIYIANVSKEMEDTLHQYEDGLRKMPRCPICQNDIDESIINKVIMQYKEEQ